MIVPIEYNETNINRNKKIAFFHKKTSRKPIFCAISEYSVDSRTHVSIAYGIKASQLEMILQRFLLSKEVVVA